MLTALLTVAVKCSCPSMDNRAVKVMRKVIRVKTKVDEPHMKTGRFRIPREREVSII